MLIRVLAQQLGRTCGSGAGVAAQLEAAAAVHQAGPASTLTAARWFASTDAPSTSDGTAASSGPAQAGGSSSSGGSRPSRPLQSKEWRSWIDTKLDSKLEALHQAKAGTAAPAAAAPAAAAEPAAARRGASSAAAPRPTGPRATGFELEQQIYSIIAPARPAEEGTLPPGVASYAQLAMAGDAPRFQRTAANIADISPQRLHPTRLFFPADSYAPAELDPYKTADVAAMAAGTQPGSKPPLNPDEVTRLADYKNAPMLSLFLSGAGKLPVRRRTQLRAKLHRHLARQVKIARTLGILSPTARWQPPAADAAGGPAAAKFNRRQQRQRA